MRFFVKHERTKRKIERLPELKTSPSCDGLYGYLAVNRFGPAFLLVMGKTYTFNKDVPCLKAQAIQERVHFKPMFEVGRAIKGMTADKALTYLEAVIDHKRAVPFFRYNEGVAHHAQGKEWGCPSARWPEKSCKLFIKLIKQEGFISFFNPLLHKFDRELETFGLELFFTSETNWLNKICFAVDDS